MSAVPQVPPGELAGAWFRVCDPGHAFLWSTDAQGPARWHAAGEGPAHYFADSPEGAWAEVLRHHGVLHEDQVPGVERAVWSVRVPEDLRVARPHLPLETLLGGEDSYPACQAEARRLRAAGFDALLAPSAALLAQGAWQYHVQNGASREVCSATHDGAVLVVFGRTPEVHGLRAARLAQAWPDLTGRIRPLARQPLF